MPPTKDRLRKNTIHWTKSLIRKMLFQLEASIESQDPAAMNTVLFGRNSCATDALTALVELIIKLEKTTATAVPPSNAPAVEFHAADVALVQEFLKRAEQSAASE